MRIAFVYDAVYPWVKGGAEKRVYEIGRRLADRGHDVHWFGLRWWGGEREMVLEGIHLHGVGAPRELYVNGRRSISEGLYFGVKTLTGLKGRFDVIDCQEFPYFSCFSAKLHSVLRASRLVITYYEVWGDYWYEYLGRWGFFGRSVERMTAWLPDIAVPISDRIKDDLKELKISEEIIRVVPNGVDFCRLNALPPAEDGFDVLYVGRLVSHKNVDVLLRAISITKKWIPDISCGIVGNGPEGSKLKNLSKELNLGNNVKFLGFVEKDEDVFSIMKSSKVFVLPSTREGFPNTILEANACGLPVIVINHEKNAAMGVVRDGYNGFISHLSPYEIAEKIVWLLHNESSTHLHRNALDFARRHDWREVVRKIEDVYMEVVKRD